MSILLAKLSTVNLILIIALAVIVVVFTTIILMRARKFTKTRKATREGYVGTNNSDSTVEAVIARTDEYHRYAKQLILRRGEGACMVDHLYVSQAGVFVLGEKTYEGKVTGHEMSPTWSERLGETTRKFINPLLEMQFGLRIITDLVGERAPIHWMLVVGGDLLGLDAEHVCNVEHLRTFLNQPIEEPLSHDEVDEIYELIRLAQ